MAGGDGTESRGDPSPAQRPADCGGGALTGGPESDREEEGSSAKVTETGPRPGCHSHPEPERSAETASPASVTSSYKTQTATLPSAATHAHTHHTHTLCLFIGRLRTHHPESSDTPAREQVPARPNCAEPTDPKRERQRRKTAEPTVPRGTAQGENDGDARNTKTNPRKRRNRTNTACRHDSQ